MGQTLSEPVVEKVSFDPSPIVPSPSSALNGVFRSMNSGAVAPGLATTPATDQPGTFLATELSHLPLSCEEEVLGRGSRAEIDDAGSC